MDMLWSVLGVDKGENSRNLWGLGHPVRPKMMTREKQTPSKVENVFSQVGRGEVNDCRRWRTPGRPVVVKPVVTPPIPEQLSVESQKKEEIPEKTQEKKSPQELVVGSEVEKHVPENTQVIQSRVVTSQIPEQSSQMPPPQEKEKETSILSTIEQVQKEIAQMDEITQITSRELEEEMREETVTLDRELENTAAVIETARRKTKQESELTFFNSITANLPCTTFTVRIIKYLDITRDDSFFKTVGKVVLVVLACIPNLVLVCIPVLEILDALYWIGRGVVALYSFGKKEKAD